MCRPNVVTELYLYDFLSCITMFVLSHSPSSPFFPCPGTVMFGFNSRILSRIEEYFRLIPLFVYIDALKQQLA